LPADAEAEAEAEVELGVPPLMTVEGSILPVELFTALPADSATAIGVEVEVEVSSAVPVFQSTTSLVGLEAWISARNCSSVRIATYIIIYNDDNNVMNRHDE
jgi:hypothetical protein